MAVKSGIMSAAVRWLDSLWRRRRNSAKEIGEVSPVNFPGFSQESEEEEELNGGRGSSDFSMDVPPEVTVPDQSHFHGMNVDLGREALEALRAEACARVMSLPGVQKLIDLQMQALAGSPEAVKASLASEQGKGGRTEPVVPGKGSEFKASLPDEESGHSKLSVGAQMSQAMERDIADAIARVQAIVDLLKDSMRSGETSKLQTMLAAAGLGGTVPSVARVLVSDSMSPALKGIPCPSFKQPVPNPQFAFSSQSNGQQPGGAGGPSTVGSHPTQHQSIPIMPGGGYTGPGNFHHMPWSVRFTRKELMKLPEFNGGKGFPCPEEAEQWMRALSLAIRVNGWNAEEALDYAQAKLTSTAATWYQNREHLFDQNPQGADAGWQLFWCMFEHKFVLHDEQALWEQFEARVQTAEESVEAYADDLRKMAGRLRVNVNDGNVRTRFLKGLYNAQVRSKVENMANLLPPTLEGLESAASHHELAGRRDKLCKSTPAVCVNMATAEVNEKKRVTDGQAPSALEFQKMLEESLQKHVQLLELKTEIASQHQMIVKLQLERIQAFGHESRIDAESELPNSSVLTTENADQISPQAVILNLIRARREAGLSTKVSDILADTEGSQAFAKVWNKHVHSVTHDMDKARVVAAAASSPPSEAEGSFECLLQVSILSRQVDVVVDTGASHRHATSSLH